MSTTEFEAIDPLGGILHPNWEKRKQEEAARANRSPIRRLLGHIATWWTADEPNIGTYDTKLEVHPEEMRRLKPPTGEEKKMLETAADVLERPHMSLDAHAEPQPDGQSS